MKSKSTKPYLKKRLKNKSFSKNYMEAEFLTKIGVAISKAREHAKLSQAHLARLLNTTQSVISRIENGNQNLTLTMLTGITRVLKCRLSVQVSDDRVAA